MWWSQPSFGIRSLLAGALCATLLAACSDPLSVGPVRKDPDGPGTSGPQGPSDMISAYVDNQQVEFATNVKRPDYYNRFANGAYYIAIQASRSDRIEEICLRLDGIRDTGVYNFNAPFSVPNQIDTLGTPMFGASYARIGKDGNIETYQTGESGDSTIIGQVHITKIDRITGLISGEFSFTAIDDWHKTVIIKSGSFTIRIAPEGSKITSITETPSEEWNRAL